MIEYAAPLAAAVPAAYQALSIAACLKRLRFRQRVGAFTPPVSILKPVRGADPAFYEAIRSQALIDYPGEYEILFGLRDRDDTALPHIARLIAEFPDRAIQIVWTTTDAPNGKVGALIDLEKQARFDLIVLSDADIRVPADYLRKVVAPLEDPQTGLVTCLYRAHGESVAARFEALGVETDFAPSALVAPFVGVDEFAFGSTIAVRRQDLRRIGNFAAVADYIADDYQIGKRIHALGLKCVLAETVVDTQLGAGTLAEAWAHQVRWARTIRVSKAGGYLGLFVTYASVWALVLAACGALWPALALLLLRMVAAFASGVLVMRSAGAGRRLWLVPLRDLWAALIWVAGLVPGKVTWRGAELTLSADGRILKD